MDWDRVEHRLERGFRASPRLYGSSIVIERRSPFRLTEVLQESLSAEEREEYDPDRSLYSGLGLPGNVSRLLEENGVEERRLLGFEWDGLGPSSSAAGIVLVGNGHRRYLCHWDEWSACSYRAFASVQPWSDRPAIAGTISRVLNRNGAGFGLGLFGSLPCVTTNDAPELVSGTVVKQAYFDLLEHWHAVRGDAWELLAEEHYGQLVEPNHLQRSLDLLERMVADAQAGGAEGWLERRRAESPPMSDEARQRLFDEWFETAYYEPRTQPELPFTGADRVSVASNHEADITVGVFEGLLLLDTADESLRDLLAANFRPIYPTYELGFAFMIPVDEAWSRLEPLLDAGYTITQVEP
jgi:hypothetical protein